MSRTDRPYAFFEHTADIGIQANASTLAAVFVALARGLTELLIDESLLTAAHTHTVTLSAQDVESLLLAWLQELLFLFSTQRFVPVEYAFDQLTPTALTCRMTGDTFDPARHFQGREVKAITRHQLHMHHEGHLWYAQVIVDL